MKVSKAFDDNEIINSLKEGSGRAYNQALTFLYKDNFRKVRNHILQNSGTEEQAADIFQDALVIFYNKVKKDEFEGRSSISTFIFGVSRNLWMQSLTKSKRHQNYTDEVKSEIATEEMKDEGVSNGHIIQKLMSKVGESCRELLVVYYYENQSTSEIKNSFKLGSEQAVRNKIYRCMQKLRSICEQENVTLRSFTFDE